MARIHRAPIAFDGSHWRSPSPLDTGPGAVTAFPLNTSNNSGVRGNSPSGTSLGGVQLAYAGFDYTIAAYGNNMTKRYQCLAWGGLIFNINQTSVSNIVKAEFIEAVGGLKLRQIILTAFAATGGYTLTATTFTIGGTHPLDQWKGSTVRVTEGGGDERTLLCTTSSTNGIITGASWVGGTPSTGKPYTLYNTNSMQLEIYDTALIASASDPIFRSESAAGDIWELQVDTDSGGDNKCRLLYNGVAISFPEMAGGWITDANINDPLALAGYGGALVGKSPSGGVTWILDWSDPYDDDDVPDLSALSNFAVTGRYATSDIAVGDYTQTGNIADCGSALWPAIDDGADDDNQADDYISEAVGGLTECRFGFADADVGAQENATVEGLGIEAIAIDALTTTTPATDFAAVIKTAAGTDYLKFYPDTFMGRSYYAPTAGAPASEVTAWTKTLFDAVTTEFGFQGKASEATKAWSLIVHIAGENVTKQANASACPPAGGVRRIFVT